MSTFSMLVPRKLGYPQTISTKIMFLSSISEICTSTTLISSTINNKGSNFIIYKTYFKSPFKKWFACTPSMCDIHILKTFNGIVSNLFNLLAEIPIGSISLGQQTFYFCLAKTFLCLFVGFCLNYCKIINYAYPEFWTKVHRIDVILCW